MDTYLTDQFLNKLPENLKASWLPGKSSFSDFYKSISRGFFRIAVSDNNFLQFIDELKKNEPELAKALLSLESSGKIRAFHIDSAISDELNISGIRKGYLRQLNGGFKIPTDTIFHDLFENRDSRDKITNKTKKPIFIEADLTDGTIEYLFREKSFNLNIGVNFNWAKFLNSYTLPFQKIRILDPYLYKNVDKVDLSGLLKTITNKSSFASIEIISSGDKKQIEKFKSVLNSISGLNANLTLYCQKSDVSDTFHKRLIWTDYWVLFAERGFDFLKLNKGLGVVKKETNLFLTGKFAAKDSIWYQLENNWQDYLNAVKIVK